MNASLGSNLSLSPSLQKTPWTLAETHKLDTDVKLEASLSHTHITVISHPVQEAAQGLGAG